MFDDEDLDKLFPVKHACAYPGCKVTWRGQEGVPVNEDPRYCPEHNDLNARGGVQ